MSLPALPDIPFERFFTYEEVTGLVRDLARAAPDLVRLSRLCQSREGRDVHLLTITDFTTGPAEDKPAYLVHGNIHAAELSGAHTSLYTARQLVADHRTGKHDLLRNAAFYIVPRLNPDGAEFVVTTSGQCRSRTDRARRRANTLYQQDMDGDGLILSMRQEHPDGTFAVDPEDSRLLIRRTKDTPGPYYRVFPEGLVHNWDGSEHIHVEGRSFDWNRNWSYDWRPEPEQPGAGDFPFSEPEMRGMGEFLHSHSNLFAVLGYHNGPNAMLRPPSTGSDDDLDGHDLGVMHEIAEIGADLTGFPVVPVIKYHMKRPGVKDCNLRGHFHNFGYHHLGLFIFEFELGTLVNSAGTPTEELFATKDQQEYEQVMRKVLSWWDEQPADGRDPIFREWTAYDHPQLGRVEIGGLLQRHMAGPTLPELRAIAGQTYEFTLRHAGYRPRVQAEDVTVQRLEGSIHRIRMRVANRGQLPTHITAKGRSLKRLEPVRVDFNPAPGVTLLSQQGHQTLGHLAGLTGSRTLEWFVSVPDGAEAISTIRVHGGTGGNCVVAVSAGMTRP